MSLVKTTNRLWSARLVWRSPLLAPSSLRLQRGNQVLYSATLFLSPAVLLEAVLIQFPIHFCASGLRNYGASPLKKKQMCQSVLPRGFLNAGFTGHGLFRLPAFFWARLAFEAPIPTSSTMAQSKPVFFRLSWGDGNGIFSFFHALLWYHLGMVHPFVRLRDNANRPFALSRADPS